MEFYYVQNNINKGFDRNDVFNHRLKRLDYISYLAQYNIYLLFTINSK